jgi:hypothetical protein
MLLEKNGRRSSSRRTRHINIRYFFVTDRIQSKELTVEYCPTEEMLADFFTKPLQGSSFRRFRAAVLNLKSDPIMSSPESQGSPQECVGNQSTTVRPTDGLSDPEPETTVDVASWKRRM